MLQTTARLGQMTDGFKSDDSDYSKREPEFTFADKIMSVG